jgi:hypothetical protein
LAAVTSSTSVSSSTIPPASVEKPKVKTRARRRAPA